MCNEELMLKCSIVRGGTSKAIFFMDNELPKEQVLRDKVILAVFGSPSLRQLDGLGGADPTTSKVAIIGPSTHPDADVDYTFGQVSLKEAFIDYAGNCGNISSGVGPYAINNGLVKINEPITSVRIHMKNTGHILKANVYVKNGKACVNGDCVIGGVPGSSSPIEMDWTQAVGCTTGKILPTGNAKDMYEVDRRQYTVSVVDGGNTVIYAKASEFGLKGTESPDEINSNRKLLDEIEKLRGVISEKIGLVDNWQNSRMKIPYQPFFALIAPPVDYITYTGQSIAKKDVDIVARMCIMQEVVKAYPGTGLISTGCAARIKGTLVEELIEEEALKKEQLNIGHPTGIITVTSIAEDNGALIPVLKKLSFVRTARILMDGYTYVRKSVLS